MALKEYYVGSVGPLYHDDVAFPEAFSSELPIAPGVGTLATQAALRGDVPSLAADAVWPIGSVFLSVVSTNPNTLLGVGTWSQIAQGQMLVGFKTGDPDFGTVEGVGGAKTATPSAHSGAAVADHADHTHAVDVGSTTSGTSGDTEHVAAGTDFWCTKGTHTHAVDPASVTSGGASATLTHSVTQPAAHAAMGILNPYFTIYVWKRTA